MNYFPAKILAGALKCHPRTAHRRAAREGWPRRGGGYFYEYHPPASLRSECRRIAQRVGTAKLRSFAASRGSTSGLRSFALSQELRSEKLRLDLRWAALCALDLDIRSGIPFERALARVARTFSTFHATGRTLRIWQKQFAAHGFGGLLESKRGRVGRKSKTL